MNIKNAKMMRSALDLFERYFLLRWVLANIIGWSLALYAASYTVQWIDNLFGVLLGGCLAGIIAGMAQMLIMGQNWRWVLRSAIGGTLGMLPLLILAPMVLLAQTFWLLVMGMLFGLCFGLMQSLELRNPVYWVLANISGAALCSVFSFQGVPFDLPVFCTLGPVTMGLITGYVLLLERERCKESLEPS